MSDDKLDLLLKEIAVGKGTLPRVAPFEYKLGARKALENVENIIKKLKTPEGYEEIKRLH